MTLDEQSTTEDTVKKGAYQANAKTMNVEDLQVLYDLARYNCDHFGTYQMLVYEDSQTTREYTNVEIAREATQLAAGLRSLGIQTGDRVLVMIQNSPEVVTGYQGIARAGAIIIPVLPLLKGPEVHYIAQNSGAKAILTSSLLLPLLQQALVDLPEMRYIISTGIRSEDVQQAQEGQTQLIAYSDVVAKGADMADHYMEHLDDVSLSHDDTAVILYTSGTTGRPKGVMLSHRNLVSNAVGGGGLDPAFQRGTTCYSAACSRLWYPRAERGLYKRRTYHHASALRHHCCAVRD